MFDYKTETLFFYFYIYRPKKQVIIFVNNNNNMIISQSFCIFDPVTASDCEITHPTLKDLVAANHGLEGWVKKKILVDPRKFLMVWVMRTILGQYGHSDTKYSQILFGLRRVVDVLV